MNQKSLPAKTYSLDHKKKTRRTRAFVLVCALDRPWRRSRRLQLAADLVAQTRDFVRICVTARRVRAAEVGSSNGTAVGSIVSTDPDVGDTRTTLVTGGSGMGVLAVDAAGAITVSNSAGLVDGATLTLNVTVTDVGGLSDTALVTVVVRPVRNFANGFEGN
jgi:hypothetical protein